MTVENISWSISTKECCRPPWGSNPRPPGLQSEAHPTEPPRLAWILLTVSTKNKDTDETVGMHRMISLYVFHMGHVKRKSAFELTQNAQIWIILHVCRGSSGLYSPFIYSVVFNCFVCRQYRPWSDCMAVQADLGLWCPQMPEDTLPLGAAQLYAQRQIII